MAMGGLWCGLGWFSAGVAIAASRLLADGARPEGWSITPLIAPLGIGFVIQVMIGAWTHLLGRPSAPARPPCMASPGRGSAASRCHAWRC